MLTAAPLSTLDPEIHAAIAAELARQQNHIELIASENFTYPAVLEAQGSVLTNKYAEGYPGKRWYGGCEQVDKVEQLAIDRAKKIFGADHANVQPHSGAQANTAVYASVLQPGDKLLGMNLSHGGHLTHGNPANFSGKLYNFCQYGVREDSGLLDYAELAAVAQREKPKMIVAPPKTATAMSIFTPTLCFNGRAEKKAAVSVAPTAGAARRWPRPSGPA